MLLSSPPTSLPTVRNGISWRTNCAAEAVILFEASCLCVFVLVVRESVFNKETGFPTPTLPAAPNDVSNEFPVIFEGANSVSSKRGAWTVNQPPPFRVAASRTTLLCSVYDELFKEDRALAPWPMTTDSPLT